MKRLKITNKHTGKMALMVSVNTSSRDNDFCQKMVKVDGAICEDCYSETMLKRYLTADEAYRRNAEILTQEIYPLDQLPRMNAHTVRFNAFGEVIDIIHLVNLFNICRVNPRTTFSLFTKRAGLVQKAIRDWGKPDNLILVYSSKFKNIQEEKPPFFDKVFTVYTKDYLKMESVAINCGALNCFDCMKCYDREDKTVHIKEIKK